MIKPWDQDSRDNPMAPDCPRVSVARTLGRVFQRHTRVFELHQRTRQREREREREKRQVAWLGIDPWWRGWLVGAVRSHARHLRLAPSSSTHGGQWKREKRKAERRVTGWKRRGGVRGSVSGSEWYGTIDSSAVWTRPQADLNRSGAVRGFVTRCGDTRTDHATSGVAFSAPGAEGRVVAVSRAGMP